MNALDSITNGSLAGKREQTVITPHFVWDNLRCEWVIDVIARDPCPDPEHSVPAQSYLDLRYTSGGLALDWCDCTYFNPPFNELEDWLEKMEYEADFGYRIAGLVPARGHRKWYRRAQHLALDTGGVVQLDPFAFRGFKDKFPVPVEILCVNFRPTDWIWHGHGEVMPPTLPQLSRRYLSD